MKKSGLIKIGKQKQLFVLYSVFCCCLLLWITFMISIHFQLFSTPEEAYKSFRKGEVYTVVEGERSGYVFGDEELLRLNKSDKGWRAPLINISVKKKVLSQDTVTIYVFQYNFSDEYYIQVSDFERNELEITDSRNSVFYQVKNEAFIENGCSYCGYVNNIADGYSITINQEEMVLFE